VNLAVTTECQSIGILRHKHDCRKAPAEIYIEIFSRFRQKLMKPENIPWSPYGIGLKPTYVYSSDKGPFCLVYNLRFSCNL